MTDQLMVKDKLADLQALAPAGYAIAMHVRFTTPTFLFQTYDRKWLDYYSQKGLVMSDPTVAWGFENRGVKDWADLAGNDPNGVLKAAKEHGLTYGITCSIGSEASPSFGSFSRADRAFQPDEVTTLSAAMAQLHTATDNIKVLSPETGAALREMSIHYTHPAGE